MYYREDDCIKHKSLVIISDCLVHDAVAVYVFSKIINKHIKQISKSPRKILYFSDGAPQQYKNVKNFVNVYFHGEDFQVSADWHFFASAHGKGPCDRVGGTLKRAAARASLQLPPDRQITTPKQLYEWASHASHVPNIIAEFSPAHDYTLASEMLKSRFNQAQPLPGTQKIHCYLPQHNCIVYVKRFSNSPEYASHDIIKSYK